MSMSVGVNPGLWIKPMLVCASPQHIWRRGNKGNLHLIRRGRYSLTVAGKPSHGTQSQPQGGGVKRMLPNLISRGRSILWAWGSVFYSRVAQHVCSKCPIFLICNGDLKGKPSVDDLPKQELEPWTLRLQVLQVSAQMLLFPNLQSCLLKQARYHQEMLTTPSLIMFYRELH